MTMDLEHAFAQLELPIDATEQQIQLAYRRLSKEAHPDSPSGDKEAQGLLNEARDMALAYTKIRGAVIPISPASLTNKIQSAIATYNRESSTDTARNLFKQKTNHLNTVKWLSWIIGAVVGAAAFMGNSIEAFQLNAQFSKELKTSLQLISAMLGAIGFVLQFHIKSMEWGLDRFLSRISDKVECARRLAKELGHKDSKTVSEEYFRKHSTRISTSFTLFTHIDHWTILLQKAVEHNLLTPLEADEITPDFRQVYSLKFKPSLFKPPPPPPPKPRTLSDVRSDLAGSLAMIGFFGVISIALIFFGLGWWAAIPGVAALIGGIGSAANLTELVNLQRPDSSLAGEMRQFFERWRPK